jgi:hypothetical protein
VDIGVGEFEFFIRDRNTHADLFRAQRVRQTLLDSQMENSRYVGRVEFRDLDTEETCITTTAVSGKAAP